MRKHEQIVAEEAQEAALNTESKQEVNHKTNEQEAAMFAKGSRGRRFKNIGKGDQSARYQWQGTTYDYGKGGKGFHPRCNARSFHYNGGYRYNGGRGSGGGDQSCVGALSGPEELLSLLFRLFVSCKESHTLKFVSSCVKDIASHNCAIHTVSPCHCFFLATQLARVIDVSRGSPLWKPACNQALPTEESFHSL